MGTSLILALVYLAPPWLVLGVFRLVPWDRSGYPLPWATPLAAALPVPELLLAILVVQLMVTRKGLVLRLAGWFVSLVLGVLATWSVGEWFYRFFYREHVVLLRDLRLLPGMVNMLFPGGGDVDLALIIASITAAILAALLIGRLLYLLILLASRHLPAAPPVRAGLFSMLLALAALQYALVPGDAPVPLLWDSLTGLGETAVAVVPEVMPVPVITAVPAVSGVPAVPDVPTVPGVPEESMRSLPELVRLPEPEPGRLPDVHVFIVESYGHTLFAREDYRQAMEPVYREFEAFLGSRGWHGVSSFMSSPAFGGRSWLAEATLLAGVRIHSQEQYDNHLASGSRNLSHRLGELGYHRLLAASGTQYSTPDWESFHEFDSYLLEKDFAYRGPFITFGRMPDQFLLYRVTRELAGPATGPAAGQPAGDPTGARPPLFGWYLLANSHVPFEAQPEYVEDWDRLGDGSIFHDSHVRRFKNNWLWGGEFPEGYLFSIEYELRIIREFMDRHLEPGNLVIILGDHQPRIPISEPEASRSVPVHVLSGTAALLEPLIRQGFQPRMIPGNEALPHRGMEEFPELLLEVLEVAGS